MQELLIKQAKDLAKATENEENWFRIFTLFEKLVKPQHNKETTLLVFPLISELLLKSIQSDRSRLNGVALEFLKECAESCNVELNFNQFFPVLLKLNGRANKVFVLRALSAVLVVSKYIELRYFQKNTADFANHINKNVRFAMFSAIKIRYSESTEFFSPLVEKGLKDPSQEVRAICKEILSQKNFNEKKVCEVKKNTILSLTPRKNFKLDNKTIEKQKPIEILKTTKEFVVRRPIESNFFEKLNKLKKERVVEQRQNEDELTPRKLDKYLEKYRKTGAVVANTIDSNIMAGGVTKITIESHSTVPMVYGDKPQKAEVELKNEQPIFVADETNHLNTDLYKLHSLNGTTDSNIVENKGVFEDNVFLEPDRSNIQISNEKVLSIDSVCQSISSTGTLGTLNNCYTHIGSIVTNNNCSNTTNNTVIPKAMGSIITNTNCSNTKNSNVMAKAMDSNLLNTNCSNTTNSTIIPKSMGSPFKILTKNRESHYKILSSQDFELHNSSQNMSLNIPKITSDTHDVMIDNQEKSTSMSKHISFLHKVAEKSLINEAVYSDNVFDMEIIEEYNNSLMLNDFLDAKSKQSSSNGIEPITDLSKSFASISIEASRIDTMKKEDINATCTQQLHDIDAESKNSTNKLEKNDVEAIITEYLEPANENLLIKEDDKQSLFDINERNVTKADETIVLDNMPPSLLLESDVLLFTDGYHDQELEETNTSVCKDNNCDGVDNTVVLNEAISENNTSAKVNAVSSVALFTENIFESDNEDVSKKSFVMTEKPNFNVEFPKDDKK